MTVRELISRFSACEDWDRDLTANIYVPSDETKDIAIYLCVTNGLMSKEEYDRSSQDIRDNWKLDEADITMRIPITDLTPAQELNIEKKKEPCMSKVWKTGYMTIE